MNDVTEKPKEEASEHIFLLANRVIDLVAMIVKALISIVSGLLAVYVAIVFLSIFKNNVGEAYQLQSIIITLWHDIVPYAVKFINIIAPVFILLFALGILHKLGKIGASPFDLKTLNDLPSILALIIIITICLLPLSGLDVPEVLNNIALVVVGFYFGKRELNG